jgi:hypothetical protein
MRRPEPRKNVLLINPWIYDFTAYDFWLKPLGLLYVASILREQAEVNLHFINCLDRFYPMLEKRSKSKADGRGHFLKEEVTKPEILKAVPRKYSRYGIPVSVFKKELERIPVPDLVLMTCTMTYWYPGVQLAVELVRETFGAAPIVLGGIYATLAEDHARQFSGADKIITGPAENKIIPLVREIWGDGSVREAEFPSFKDMPCPAFDLLNNKDSLPLLTSRGCPFTCAFCAGPLLYDRFEQRNPEDVVAEIADHAERFGTRHFAFYDDALLLKPESHIIPILEEVVRRKWPVSFHTPNGLHIREIDLDMAHLFRSTSVRSQRTGMSSGKPVLKSPREIWRGRSAISKRPVTGAKTLACISWPGFQTRMLRALGKAWAMSAAWEQSPAWPISHRSPERACGGNSSIEAD